MKFKSILRSNHDLKKNGYRILRKLHKMESCKGADKAYASAFDDTYFFVLSVRALVEIISIEYPEEKTFLDCCNRFLSYLDDTAKRKQRINCSVLASFLHTYTVLFNRVIASRHSFTFSEEIRELWNTKCLMAFIATWGSNS